MKKTLLAGTAILAVVPMAAAQSVTTYNDTLNFDNGNGELIVGDGISSSGFVITRTDEMFGGSSNQIEIGLSTIERWEGATNVGVNQNTYTVQPGLSTTTNGGSTLDPDRSWWNFNFSVDLGARDLSNTVVQLSYDFLDDGNAAAVYDFGQAILAAAPGFDLSTVSQFQNSWNLGFQFLSDNAGYDIFNPFAPGTYEFRLDVLDTSGGTISSVTMQTVVVPLPGAAGMALAGMGLIGLRRRR